MHYSSHLLRHLRLTIGQNIHKIRVGKRLPLKKLAELTAIPESLLDHYELGKNEIRLEELLRISCVLRTDMGELIRG